MGEESCRKEVLAPLVLLSLVHKVNAQLR